MKSMTLRTKIAADGTIDLHVSSDLPPGDAEVVVVVQPVTVTTPRHGPPFPSDHGVWQGKLPDVEIEADLNAMNRLGESSMEQAIDVADTAKTGRLEELNGHGTLTGRLWEPNGTKWLCHFKEEHLEQLPDAWMRTARVIGRAIVKEGKERIFEVESLIVLGTEMETLSTTAAMPFWTSLSLDELAEQQGVCPVSDLDAISNLWPADDDADDLLQHVLHERAVRRSLSAEDQAR